MSLHKNLVEEITLQFLVRAYIKIFMHLGILSIPPLKPHAVSVLIAFQDFIPFPWIRIRLASIPLDSQCSCGSI